MADTKFIRFRANLAKSSARLPVIWVRHRGLTANDVFLASYPRSGNTWLRFVLGELLAEKAIDFDNVDDVIPELKWHQRGIPLFASGGRLIKTHEPWRKEYRKAIYIVRDARDCALSQFARSAQLGIADPDMDEFLDSFLSGTFHGYGAWGRHIRSWLNSPLAHEGKLLVVKFEDLRRSPEEQLTRMVQFVGAPAGAEEIRTSLANNSVDQMRAKEVKSRKLYQSTTEVGRFVRKGAVQGWRSKLTPAQLQRFDQAMGAELAQMGYPSGSEVGVGADQANLQPIGG
jgi:hypothetical protein